MPVIPRTLPTGNQLTTQSPRAFQREPDNLGKRIGVVGETVHDVGELFKQANLVAEKTRAQNDLESKLTDIKSRAAQDNDLSDAKRQSYNDEITKAVGDSSQNITIPFNRSIFATEAQSKAAISQAHVDNIFHKKIVSDAKANLDVYLNNKKNDFIQAQSPAEKNSAVLERDTKIQEMVKGGFLDTASATKLQAKQKDDWAKSQVEYDIATNPEMAKELLSGKHYPDISEEERVNLLNKSKIAIRQNNKNAADDIELAQINNEADHLAKFASGEAGWMDLGDVASQVRSGALPEKFGAAYADVIKAQGDFEPTEKENQNYPEFINAVYAAKDKKELQATMLGLLKDHKNMSQEKLAVLINGALQRGKALNLRPTQLDPKQQEIDSAAKAVVNMGRRTGMSNNEISDAYQNFNKDITAGKTAKEAYDNAMKTQAIKKNPAILNLPAEGKIMIDSDGNKALVFPDGSYKEIGSSPAKKESKPNAVQPK